MNNNPDELIGIRLDTFVVLELYGQPLENVDTYLTRCDCGDTYRFTAQELTDGTAKCIHTKQYFKNPIGERFDHLLVLTPVANGKFNQRRYLCRCDCNRELIIDYNSLRCGRSKSCGCLQRECVTHHICRVCRQPTEERHANMVVPALCKNIYDNWNVKFDRCYNSNRDDFVYWGGKGISVCPEWHRDNPNGLYNFYLFAIATGFKPKLHLHRIGNDGNYDPSNCVWLTASEHSRIHKI